MWTASSNKSFIEYGNWNKRFANSKHNSEIQRIEND